MALLPQIHFQQIKSIDLKSNSAHCNTMSEIEHMSATDGSVKAIEILNRDGCVVIDDLLQGGQVDQLSKDLNVHFDAASPCDGSFYGKVTKRLGGLFTKSSVCRDMAIHPLIMEIMDNFLLPGDTNAYQINLTQGISIGPGECKQIIHQDDPMFPFLHPEHEVMLNCMWAVDDFTKENGATGLILGSHKWTRDQVLTLDRKDPPNIVQAAMRQGSVLIYLGSLFHAGRENRTEKPRRGAVISYCLGWLRQAENSYLAYSLEEVCRMPKHLQRLLGYFVHHPNLGSVNGMDPIHYVNGDVDQPFTEYIQDSIKHVIDQYRQDQQNEHTQE